MSHRIAVIPGDGIGPEVIAEGVPVLEQLGLKLTFFDWGANKWLREHIGLPKDALQNLSQNFDAIYFGALGDPRIPDMAHGREILLGLRTGLDLYANIRPIKLLDERLGCLKNKTCADINFTVFRENTQDMYGGLGHVSDKSTLQETTIDESLHTYAGVSRIIKLAFEQATQSVTLGHKSNAIQYGGALWQRAFNDIAPNYPNIKARQLYIDTMAMEFVRAPEQFDIIVTSNLFGDILTDLGAGISGGLGLAASANIHPGKIGLFEPVHGSAPDIAGENLANPMAAFLSAALLLDFLGLKDPANSMRQAVTKAIQKNICTPDLGGQKTTQEVGHFIRAQL
jgi:3-isopropylmalate dehydrogenase